MLYSLTVAMFCRIFQPWENAFLKSGQFSVCSVCFRHQGTHRIEGNTSCLEEQKPPTPASVTYSLLQPKGCRGKGKYKGRLNIYAWARKVWKVDWGGRWAGEREDWPHADSAHPCKLWSGLKESTAVFTLISTAVWWSTGATWGYRMSPVYSATWAQTAESQDVSLRGTIDPTVSVGGKPGRSNHIRPTLTCHMSRVFLNNSLFFTY